MKLGILGTGRVAQTLAAAWSKAGHDVQFGSRDPDSKSLEFPVADLAHTIETSDIVVNATLGSKSLQTLTNVGAASFAGKIVIDVANANTPAFELVYPNSSLAEHLQEAFPEAKIVKTMNTAAMVIMTEPSTIGPSSVFLSGDDSDAKSVGGNLLVDLGWQRSSIVDLGGIQSARGPEHYFLMFAALMQHEKSPKFNVLLVD